MWFTKRKRLSFNEAYPGRIRILNPILGERETSRRGGGLAIQPLSGLNRRGGDCGQGCAGEDAPLAHTTFSRRATDVRVRGYVFKLLSALLLALTPFIVAAAPGHHGSGLIELVVSTNFIQLGDNQPTWETTVHIRGADLRRSSYAAVEFVAVGVWAGTSSNLIVNGRKYVLPISEPLTTGDIPFRGKTVVPIPVGALQRGDNKIGFEAGPIFNNPSNPWDDFQVGDIVLVLSR